MAPFTLLDALADGLLRRGIQPDGMSLDAYTAAIFEELAALPGIDRGRLPGRDGLRPAGGGAGRAAAALPSGDGQGVGTAQAPVGGGGAAGGQRGAAILYSFGGRAVMVRYDAPDPVTNRYALRPVPPAALPETLAGGRGGDAADPPG